jgi:hypothetical protein
MSSVRAISRRSPSNTNLCSGGGGTEVRANARTGVWTLWPIQSLGFDRRAVRAIMRMSRARGSTPPLVVRMLAETALLLAGRLGPGRD